MIQAKETGRGGGRTKKAEKMSKKRRNRCSAEKFGEIKEMVPAC